MGIFLHTVLFPGGREEECREALARCGADPQLGLRPADCRWRQCARGPAVLLNDGFAGAELLAARLSFRLEYPLMVLFLYDGDFWGYCGRRERSWTDFPACRITLALEVRRQSLATLGL